MEIYLENSMANIKESEWDSLVPQAATNTVFQTYRWNNAWLQTVGADKQPFIVCALENKKLVGVAPLLNFREGAKKTLRFIGIENSDYMDFIYPSGRIDIALGLLDFIEREKSAWTAIDLDNIPAQSQTSEYLISFCSERNLYCGKTLNKPCPALMLSDKNFFKLVLDKADNRLKREKKFFAGKKNCKTVHLTESAKILEYLDNFFEQHIRRWADTATPSLFLYERNRIFYKKMVIALCERGWLVFSVFESENNPIAFHLGFTYGGQFIYYKPVFNVSFGKYSPGNLLLLDLLKYADEKNYREFDFSKGADVYKKKYANTTRYIVSYKLLRKNMTLLLYKMRKALSRVKHFTFSSTYPS